MEVACRVLSVNIGFGEIKNGSLLNISYGKSDLMATSQNSCSSANGCVEGKKEYITTGLLSDFEIYHS